MIRTRMHSGRATAAVAVLLCAAHTATARDLPDTAPDLGSQLSSWRICLSDDTYTHAFRPRDGGSRRPPVRGAYRNRPRSPRYGARSRLAAFLLADLPER